MCVVANSASPNIPRIVERWDSLFMRFLAIAVSETTKPGTSLNMLSMNNVLQRFTRPKSVSLGNLQIAFASNRL
jgi:hypothetical protein